MQKYYTKDNKKHNHTGMILLASIVFIGILYLFIKLVNAPDVGICQDMSKTEINKLVSKSPLFSNFHYVDCKKYPKGG